MPAETIGRHDTSGRHESSGRGGSLVCRPARLATVTVMKSPSSFKVFVEVFPSGMSISNTLLGSIVVGTVRVEKWVIPMMMSRNFANRWPCKGFVKKSVTMIPVGQCTRLISPLAIRSLMKKHRMLTWRDFCLADERPFLSILIALMLSW
jgi:hypothetical protein